MISAGTSSRLVAIRSTPSLGGPVEPPLYLHLFQLAGLLDCPQRRDDRIEHEEQHEHAVLVEVQLAVARLVARTAVVVQSFEQRREPIEILQTGDVGCRNGLVF